MNRLEMIKRVRSFTRDFSNSIFREQDIIDYLNEGINRIKQLIPEFRDVNSLTENNSVPLLLPEMYHHLIPVYATSRCFGQDERHYQASTFMNEFETKVDELKSAIAEGSIVVIDPETGEPVDVTYNVDYVVDTYFN